MYILDTQIISYAFKGTYDGRIAQQSISSVTAKEFLLAQGVESTKVGYHIPLLKKSGVTLDTETPIPVRRFSKKSTDQIAIDFGHDYPSIIEYGNLAVSEVINMRAKKVLKASLTQIEKSKRRIILDRFDFLSNQNITCVPLNKRTVELGLSLFYEFVSSYNLKENFRNSVNDIFILAAAVSSSGILITKDSLLNRFAAEQYDAKVKEKEDTLLIDFRENKYPEKYKGKDSKGYINTGWKIQARNYQGAW